MPWVSFDVAWHNIKAETSQVSNKNAKAEGAKEEVLVTKEDTQSDDAHMALAKGMVSK
jgi:hypothetical protein